MSIVKKARIIKKVLYRLVILSFCISIQAGEYGRSRYYTQGGGSSSEATYAYSLDGENISDNLDKKKKRKKRYLYYTLITVVVFSAVYYFFIRNDEDEEEDEVIVIPPDIQEQEDLNRPIDEAKAAVDIQKFNEQISHMGASQINALKDVTGDQIAEGNWFTANIKKVSDTGANNEDDAMRWFCKHAKVVLNEKILNYQFKPSLEKVSEILAKKLGKKRHGEGYTDQVNIKMTELLDEIKGFFEKFEPAYKTYRTNNRGLRLPVLTNYSFYDDDSRIYFTRFKRIIQSRSELQKQMIRIWSIDNGSTVTPKQERDSRNLFYYLFVQMGKMLEKHKSNAETNKTENGKYYDKDDYLGEILAIMERIAAILFHCHGRTKRATFEVFSKVGLPAGHTPAQVFTEMYWVLDAFKVHILDKALLYINALDPSNPTEYRYSRVNEGRFSHDELDRAREVHGQNYLMKLLQPIKFPGQEMVALDGDSQYYDNGIQKEYATLEYFKHFNPKWVLDNFTDYIENAKKVEDISLSIERANSLYYGLVYDVLWENVSNKNSEGSDHKEALQTHSNKKRFYC